MVIVLDTTTRTLTAKLLEAKNTNEVQFTAHWADSSSSGSALSEGDTPSLSSGTAAITVVAAPGGTTRRDIKFVTIYNPDVISHTVLFYLNDNGTLYQIGRGTVPTLTSCNLDALISSATTTLISQATSSVLGLVKLTVAALIDAGIDSVTAMTIDQFVASKRNVRHIPIRVTDSATAFVTGTTVGGDWRLPTVTGTIIDCGTYTDTAGVTGTAIIDIHKNGTTIMTTNKIAIASAQKSSEDGGATQPTITAGGYLPNDILTIDKDTAHGFPALGLVVWVDLRES
jgi:hypothetical protein